MEFLRGYYSKLLKFGFICFVLMIRPIARGVDGMMTELVSLLSLGSCDSFCCGQYNALSVEGLMMEPGEGWWNSLSPSSLLVVYNIVP